VCNHSLLIAAKVASVACSSLAPATCEFFAICAASLAPENVGRYRANLKSDYWADDVWIDRERFHLGSLALNDEKSPPALKCDLRSSHEGVVGGLRLEVTPFAEVHLVDSVLNRLGEVRLSKGDGKVVKRGWGVSAGGVTSGGGSPPW
jgi:hypothetical protein